MNTLHLLFLLLAVVAASQLLADFDAIGPFLEGVGPSDKTEDVRLVLSEYPDTYEEASMEQQAAFDALAYGCLLESLSPLLKLLMRKWHGVPIYNDVLVRAAILRDLELVGCALDAGADVHYIEDSALFWALSYGHIALVRLLLSRGADATARQGEFPKMAVYTRELELLQLILDQPGVDVNGLDGSAISAAVEQNWIPGAKLLLERQADPNEDCGWILIYAVGCGSFEVVKLLMDQGAGPYAHAIATGSYTYSHLDILCAAYTRDNELLAQKLAGFSIKRFFENAALQNALWLAADKLSAPTILQIMQFWDQIQWKDHVHLGPAFGEGKNYGEMLGQLLRQMIPEQKRILLAAAVRFDSKAANVVLETVRYDAALDGGKTLYLAAMRGDEVLCRHIITNCSDNLNIGHLVAAAGIAAKHLNPMAMMTLREIIKEWDDRKTSLLGEEVEDRHVSKRQRL